jgi:hypothetical protein
MSPRDTATFATKPTAVTELGRTVRNSQFQPTVALKCCPGLRRPILSAARRQRRGRKKADGSFRLPRDARPLNLY